jgi:hypothetical protein
MLQFWDIDNDKMENIKLVSASAGILIPFQTI